MCDIVLRREGGGYPARACVEKTKPPRWMWGLSKKERPRLVQVRALQSAALESGDIETAALVKRLPAAEGRLARFLFAGDAAVAPPGAIADSQRRARATPATPERFFARAGHEISRVRAAPAQIFEVPREISKCLSLKSSARDCGVSRHPCVGRFLGGVYGGSVLGRLWVYVESIWNICCVCVGPMLGIGWGCVVYRLGIGWI